MTAGRATRHRIAVFGLLGSGNIGNEGSLQAVLTELARHPGIELSAICAGPDDVRRRYGIPAVSMTWSRLDRPARTRAGTAALKAVGKVLDPFRMVGLLRRVDAVVVPGMGVLEDTLPLHPWGFPYALLGLTFAGRLTGTPVVLVCVGATRARDPLTRWALGWAARAATYRSYRDAPSRDAVTGMGVDTTGDSVYPDLAFALPLPEGVQPAPWPTVAVGVMAWRGRAEDRRDGESILSTYLARMTELVTRLVDDGYSVRLITGDPDDTGVAASVRTAVIGARPVIDPGRVTFAPADSLAELMDQIAPVHAVVASRYHNVLCALRLAKPTVSLGYAGKNRALMQEMGLGGLCLDIRDVDVEEVARLLSQALEERSRIARDLRARDAARGQLLAGQWPVLLSVTGVVPPSSGVRPVIGWGGPARA